MNQSGYRNSSMFSSRMPREQETIYFQNEELVPEAILLSWLPSPHYPLCVFLNTLLPWRFALSTNNSSAKQSQLLW